MDERGLEYEKKMHDFYRGRVDDLERERDVLIQRNRELHKLNARLSGHTLARDLAAAIEALKDARSFVISIQRNEGRWENAATGILSRIDAALDKLKGGDNVNG